VQGTLPNRADDLPPLGLFPLFQRTDCVVYEQRVVMPSVFEGSIDPIVKMDRRPFHALPAESAYFVGERHFERSKALPVEDNVALETSACLSRRSRLPNQRCEIEFVKLLRERITGTYVPGPTRSARGSAVTRCEGT
jgi:hypothetical protein